MEDNLKLEKINFIEQNIAFFTQKSHYKLNERDNVSTALLTIILSEKRLCECRNYPILLNEIKNYNNISFYTNFIELISNLQTYVMRIFNYDIEAQIIKRKMDELIELYKNNYLCKTKKLMA